MNEHMESLKSLYAPKPTDSYIVRKSKAEMNALLAGETHYEFDGKSYPLQTREQAMHALGLNARYSNSAPQTYAGVRG